MKSLIGIIALLLLPFGARAEETTGEPPSYTPMGHGKDFQHALVLQQYPRTKTNLLSQMERPEVVTDGFGLLVERDFGNRGSKP